MNFFKMFLHGLAIVPGVVQSVEELAGAKTGTQKKNAALAIVGTVINVADGVSNKQIVDAPKFTDGLGAVIDGVVTCLNASIWAKL